MDFLEQHRFCCFCGGDRASEEADHIPARTLFNARHWPEGFVFPACHDCNSESRYDEQLLGMISRLYPDGGSEAERLEFVQKVGGIANNIPGALQEMRMSANAIRRALRKYNIPRDPTRFLHEYNFLKVDGPIVHNAVHQFARKLFLALHYKHTRSPLPQEGGIAIKWFTNIQIHNGVIPTELMQYLRRQVPLKELWPNLVFEHLS